MYQEEFGDRACRTIVMLHGAFFTNTFGRQIALSDRWHLVVPHLMGFGREAGRTFRTGEEIRELKELCRTFERPALVGFSLGAQLAFQLVSEEPELFCAAVLVSPWLLGKDPLPQDAMEQNLKMYRKLRNRIGCGLIARMNGMPRDQRIEFTEAMQRVTEETVRNAVDNGISFATAPGYPDVRIPMLAIAGAKENGVMQESVWKLQAENPCCTAEIWEGAAHNIPPLFYKKFNQRLTEFLAPCLDS